MALLTPLTKLGYHVLALEIPVDQQGPLRDWATGQTAVVPPFFARPFADGRGNIQALLLIRTALSAPFNWHLICFDRAQQNDARDIQKMAMWLKSSPENRALQSFSDQAIANEVSENLEMARTFSVEQAKLGGCPKVLVICGDFHARTFSQSAGEMQTDLSTKGWLAKLQGWLSSQFSRYLSTRMWPTFAAALKSQHPSWRIHSIRLVALSGGYFGMTSDEHGFHALEFKTIRGDTYD